MDLKCSLTQIIWAWCLFQCCSFYQLHFSSFCIPAQQACTQPWVSAPSLPDRNWRNAGSVDVMIWNILHDWPFSWNQPLTLAHDYYIGVLKNKARNLYSPRWTWETEKIRPCNLNKQVCHGTYILYVKSQIKKPRTLNLVI